jgi:hypothetical protein
MRVIKTPQRRRPRPELGCRAIGLTDGLMDVWMDDGYDSEATIKKQAVQKLLVGDRQIHTQRDRRTDW